MFIALIITLAIVAAVAAGFAVGRSAHDNLVARVRKQTAEAQPPVEGRYSADLVHDQPGEVQRFFNHAIAPDTPFASAVTLEMEGQFRPKPEGGFAPFTATEILSNEGFLWEASVAFAPNRTVEGADGFGAQGGFTRFYLFRYLPKVSASGPEASQSAAARAVGEFLWFPHALLPQAGTAWSVKPDGRITFYREIHGWPVSGTLTLEPSGAVRELVMARHRGGPDKGLHTFVVTVEEYGVFARYTVPIRVRASWHSPRIREDFFIATIKSADYR